MRVLWGELIQIWKANFYPCCPRSRRTLFLLQGRDQDKTWDLILHYVCRTSNRLGNCRDSLRDCSFWLVNVLGTAASPNIRYNTQISIGYKTPRWVCTGICAVNSCRIWPTFQGIIIKAMTKTSEKKSVTYRRILKHIQCDKYSWHIRGCLKVIVFLLGLQPAYNKLCCFFCEWYGRAQESKSLHIQRPLQKTFIPGQKSITTQHVVNL